MSKPHLFFPAMTYRQLTQCVQELDLELKKKAEASPNSLATYALEHARNLTGQILEYVRTAQKYEDTPKVNNQ